MTLVDQPLIPDLPPALQRTMTPPAQVGSELLQLIKDSIVNHPRSQQVRIGPSELGHECARRIAHKMAGTAERPNQKPNWKATVGTYGHAGLEQVLDDDNLRYAERTGNGQERWLVETRVNVGEVNGVEITGSSDAFDRVTGTVIDWKFVGKTMLQKYMRKGPGDAYRKQAHLYGRGFTRMGLTVRHVMIVFLPRDGELHDAYVWTEPYDEQVALDALQRATGIAVTLDTLGDEAFAVLPTADAFCPHCPFFVPGTTDLVRGCPGDPAMGAHNRSHGFNDLVP